MKEFVNSLYSFIIAKETEPSSSNEEEEIILLIQESSESDSEVSKPKKEKKPPMVNELSASESDSEVDKEKENPLEDDHYGIVIEKEIYSWLPISGTSRGPKNMVPLSGSSTYPKLGQKSVINGNKG